MGKPRGFALPNQSPMQSPASRGPVQTGAVPSQHYEASEEIHVVVKPLQGQKQLLDCRRSDTVEDIASQMKSLTGVDVKSQTFMYKGNQLMPGQRLQDSLPIDAESVVLTWVLDASGDAAVARNRLAMNSSGASQLNSQRGSPVSPIVESAIQPALVAADTGGSFDLTDTTRAANTRTAGIIDTANASATSVAASVTAIAATATAATTTGLQGIGQSAQMSSEHAPSSGFSSDTFSLAVKTLQGKSYTLDNCHASDTVEVLRQRMCTITGTSPQSQRFVYNGKEVKPGQCLGDHLPIGSKDVVLTWIFLNPRQSRVA